MVTCVHMYISTAKYIIQLMPNRLYILEGRVTAVLGIENHGLSEVRELRLRRNGELLYVS